MPLTVVGPLAGCPCPFEVSAAFGGGVEVVVGGVALGGAAEGDLGTGTAGRLWLCA
ncbi:MAG: hypothetical protein HRU70_00495 [Phycisphaeraceae bacterium]|nr:MAG: hypothetical protein HRU70_00495 [Phycisphaeraceae bacterium]